jgi:hypothetical protein
LVACVVSKKFIKFLRKSLKEFDLNLKRKVVLKEVCKKRKKEKAYLSPFGPARPAGPPDSPASGPPNRPFFFFSADADTWAPLVSLTLSPFLSSSPPRCQPTRRRRTNPAAPRHFPSLPLHQTGQLRQLTPASINWSRYFP